MVYVIIHGRVCMAYRIRPRVLVDVSQVDMSTTVLGYPISAPILLAPTASHKLAIPEGQSY